MIAAVCCSGSPNSKKKDNTIILQVIKNREPPKDKIYNIKFDLHYGISGDVREV